MGRALILGQISFTSIGGLWFMLICSASDPLLSAKHMVESCLGHSLQWSKFIEVWISPWEASNVSLSPSADLILPSKEAVS